MGSRRGWALRILVMGGLGGLGGALGPYAMAVFYTAQGAQALATAVQPVFPDRLAPAYVVDSDRLQAAIAHLQAALAWDPRHLAARRLLAQAYAAQNRPREALEVLDPAAADFPDDPMVALERGDLYDMIGDVEAAIREYERGHVGSRRAPLGANLLKEAEAQVAQGHLDLAARLWQQALALDPGNLAAALGLLGFYRHLGDVDGAAEITARLQRFGPEAVAVPVDLDFRLPRAQGRAMARLVEEGLWDPGTLERVVAVQLARSSGGLEGLMLERLLQEVAARRPGLRPWAFYLAELAHRRGDLRRAEALYRAAWETRPDLTVALRRLGAVAEAAGTAEGTAAAAAFYWRYLQAVPEDLYGWARWAAACAALGERGVSTPACAMAAADRQAWVVRADDRATVAEVLGVPAAAVVLGENRVPNGGFEAWEGEAPAGWVWSDMSNRPPWSPALFLGGTETLEPFAGTQAARIDGLWAAPEVGREEARAGFWLAQPIPLSPGIYVLSFMYRARLAPGARVGVWVSKRPEVLFAGERWLPDTQGAWRKALLIARNEAVDGAVQPLLRLWGGGEVAFDEVALQALQGPLPVAFPQLPIVVIR